MNKFLSRFLIATLMMAVMSGTESFASSEESFSDVDSTHENYDAIEGLKSQGVVEGYSDGSYKADNTINRAEFLKIVMGASDSESAGKDCYDDVSDEWFAPYVCGATKLGFVKGYDDGLFRPEQTINFAEASKIVANIMDVEQPEEHDWSYWYQPYVISLEVVDAVPTTIPSFSHSLTRGEMSEMIWRVENPGYYDSSTFRSIKNGLDAAASNGELASFESCVELEEHVAFNSDAYYDFYEGMESYYDAYYYDDWEMAEEVFDSAAPVSVEAESGAVDDSSAKSSADEASETNVQVAGVDEADIVKNDLEYIYVLKDSTVRIVDAYPAEEMNEINEVTFDDADFTPYDMYVDGDRLVVLGQVYSTIYEDFYGEAEPLDGDLELAIDYDYYYNWDSLTKVYVFDISDKENVEVIRSVVFEGDYSSSRKVDDQVYVVLNRYEDYYSYDEEWDDEDILPLAYDSAVGKIEPVAGCGDIWYYPGVDSTDYLVLASIPVDDAKAAVEEEVILGSSGDVYSSRENLYVAEYSYNYNWWGWDDYGNDDEESIIHKFSLNDGDIAYEGEGRVPGTVLNQFSMDESDGYFRVATTVGDAWDSSATNNLYVLDGNMNQVGSVEGIAPGETIYSVRFMGDRAYMVTFKKVDPFFVIDVSQPTSPVILGELKIPGYSDYLHPYGEDYVIGFGKDTVESDEDNWWGTSFAWYQGLKIAMFDVSDLENPKELHKVIIGDRGTESELLYNHKALLFDASKGLMALPVTLAELPDEVKESSLEGNEYGDTTWQGAYIYDVSVEAGFQLKGKISHYDEGEIEAEEWWYSGPQDIKRILYIGDVLYTVSMDAVQANDMDTLEKIMKVILPSG